MKSLKTAILAPGLYLVATPIGNLRDITLRAIDVLGGVDFIVCEDTRVTGKLLNASGIDKKKLISYNDHNADRQRSSVIKELANGSRVALVSDAGMPLISDPGYKLVRDCSDMGIYVTTVPGPSASLSALQLSGIPSDKFSFIGFLPAKSSARKKVLEEWLNIPGTLIAFESGPRLSASLQDICSVMGDREVAVVREITKIYEEVRKDSALRLARHYEESGAPKGEIVLVISPAVEKSYGDDDLARHLEKALKEMSIKDAASFVSEATGVSKKKLYEMALLLKK
jgi:16S rRNA (cytidine1402-2'-O)-methyltransferase